MGKSIGEIIRQYVEYSGITYRDFAGMAGLTSGYISMLVNNRNPKTGNPIVPTIDTFERVASAMGIGVEELLSQMHDRQHSRVHYGSMSIKERLEAIADALETASKQARLLAEEVDVPCAISADTINAAQAVMNRRVDTGDCYDAGRYSED